MIFASVVWGEQIMLVVASGVDAQSLSDRAREILPLVSEHAKSGEDARQISADVIKAIKDIGFFRSIVPAAYGGDEDDLYDWAQTCRTIASADMATAWVCGVLGGHSYGVTYFSKQAQDEVWANGPDAMVCSSLAPLGKATRVEGGVKVTGRYGFSSGSDYSDWAMIGFLLFDDPEGPPSYRLGLLPRKDYTIHDDWQTSGMRGTGSKTLVVEDVFIPEHRWFGPGVDRGPMDRTVHSNPVYNVSLDWMSAFFPCVLVGGAEGALQIAAENMKNRKPALPGRGGASTSRQQRLGEAALQIRAAGTVLDNCMRQRVEALNNNHKLGPQESAWLFADETYATRIARKAVDMLLEETGGGAQFLDKPVQRFWRDIHTGSEHVQLDMIARSEACGAMLLDIEANGSMF
jgi:alkylation response protein AidB-like acyl-CoA dehydrogenase